VLHYYIVGILGVYEQWRLITPKVTRSSAIAVIADRTACSSTIG